MITIASPTEQDFDMPETDAPKKEKASLSPVTIIIALLMICTIFLLFLSPSLGIIVLAISIICIAIALSKAPDNQVSNSKTSIEYREDMTGLEYEKLVAERLSREGYTNIRVTPGSGDHGADILAEEPNGESVAIQCKKYSAAVGQHAVQEAVAARDYYKCQRAMVITNSTFTPAAYDFAENTNTVLKENYT